MDNNQMMDELEGLFGLTETDKEKMEKTEMANA